MRINFWRGTVPVGGPDLPSAISAEKASPSSPEFVLLGHNPVGELYANDLFEKAPSASNSSTESRYSLMASQYFSRSRYLTPTLRCSRWQTGASISEMLCRDLFSRQWPCTTAPNTAKKYSGGGRSCWGFTDSYQAFPNRRRKWARFLALAT